MDGRDSEVRPDAPIDEDGLSFEVPPVAAEATAQRGAPTGYFIERPMVGYRFAGARGSFAAVLGLVLGPAIVLFGCWLLYERFGDLELVKRALTGMAAAAVGLTIATVLKVSRTLPRRWKNLLIVAAVFTAIGLMRLPFIGVFAIAAPVAVWMAWREER